MIYSRLLYNTISIFFLVANIKAWPPLEYIKLNGWSNNSAASFISTKMRTTPKFVVISHTATPTCVTLEQCIYLLNYAINNSNIEEASPEVFAHFYVGGDARIYIGRDWNVMGDNNFNCGEIPIIEISLIGNFKYTKFLNKQFRAVQQLLEYGLMNKKLSDSYKLFGVWQLVGNITPSKLTNIDLIIKSWPHWNSNDLKCFPSISDNIIN